MKQTRKLKNFLSTRLFIRKFNKTLRTASKRLNQLRAVLVTWSGNMKLNSNKCNIWNVKSKTYTTSSTDLSTSYTEKQVWEILFLKRKLKQFSRQMRPKTRRLIRFSLLLELTQLNLTRSDTHSKRLKTQRTLPSGKSKMNLRRSEKLTQTWSRPTKANFQSSVSQSKNLDSIL